MGMLIEVAAAIFFVFLFFFLAIVILILTKKHLDGESEILSRIRSLFYERNLTVMGAEWPTFIAIGCAVIYIMFSFFVQIKGRWSVPPALLVTSTFSVFIIAWAVVQLPLSIFARAISINKKDYIAHILLDIARTIAIILIGIAVILCAKGPSAV